MSISAFKIMAVAGDGLSAQRTKMNTVSENIANAETTRTATGGPYQRQRVVFTEAGGRPNFQSELRGASLRLRQTRTGHISSVRPKGGPGRPAKPAVSADATADPADQPRMIFDPSHPDANADGYVAMPDIDIITEMVDLMSATRAYEANLTAVEAAKGMVDKALDI
jgi:flagellar basal-body rod protein FlgC